MTAGVLVNTRHRAISDIVISLLATVGAGDLGLVEFALLLGTGLGGVTKLTAVGAQGDHAISGKAGVFEALEVLFFSLGPSFGHLRTARGEAVLKRDRVLAVHLTLEVDNGMGAGDLLLSGDEPNLHVGLTEGNLKCLQVHRWSRLAVDGESLQTVSMTFRRVSQP